jgi:hypothetical protein
MSNSANLGLPFIEAGQAQKHVTHNEALRLLDTLVQLAVLDRDLNAPPGSPAEGQRWIVKASPAPTGAWAGHGNHIAVWQDGFWQFSAPKTGFVAYVVDEGALLYWDGDSWEAVQLATALQNLSLLGIGTTADATNPVNAKLNNALWVAKTVAEGGDGNLRYKLSKESAAKTLSFLFQDNYSGRAEIGLTGDDDFHFKVSADGSAWIDALLFDKTTGAAKVNAGFFLAGDLSPSQITADQNDYSPTGLATATVLRLSSDAVRNITGLSGGGDGRVIAIVNVGSNGVTLKDENSSSSAGNRFAFGADLKLDAKHGAVLWYDATDSRWKLVAPRLSAREVLTANRTYYVRSDGSDSNAGLANTAGGAFLTIQKAVDVINGALDAAGYTITIQIGDGTYTGAVNLKNVIGFGGAGTLIIQGNNATPANVHVSVAADAFKADGIYAIWDIKDLKITAPGNAITAVNGASVRFGNMNFGAAGIHICADIGGTVIALSSYTVSAAGYFHWQATGGGKIYITTGLTITITGTLAFNTWAYVGLLGLINCYGLTFSGSATGMRYNIFANSAVFTNGAATTYLPGNSAGSTATGGQYT